MFPFDLSLFDTGLMIAVAALVFLYLVILIKLKPSTPSERTRKKDAPEQKIFEKPLADQQVKPETHDMVKEETPEPNERQETVSPAPFKAGDNGCSHHFGYLAEHPKNNPMPNECLTCTKIMECLSKAEKQ
jgi:hypothetical protein